MFHIRLIISFNISKINKSIFQKISIYIVYKNKYILKKEYIYTLFYKRNMKEIFHYSLPIYTKVYIVKLLQ